jgi:hypothetical protein
MISGWDCDDNVMITTIWNKQFPIIIKYKRTHDLSANCHNYVNIIQSLMYAHSWVTHRADCHFYAIHVVPVCIYLTSMLDRRLSPEGLRLLSTFVLWRRNLTWTLGSFSRFSGTADAIFLISFNCSYSNNRNVQFFHNYNPDWLNLVYPSCCTFNIDTSLSG